MKEFIIFILAIAATIIAYAYQAIGIDAATFIVFILIVGLLIVRDRKHVKLEGIVFIRRTKKGRDFISNTAQRHKRFWRYAGIAGVAIGVFVLVFGSIFLIGQAASIFAGNAQGGVRLILPGPVSAPTSAPGVFIVPWWMWIIGVAIVLFPHEFMHGIMCRIDNIRIKSVGWILLAIIPGAFVEPDQKQIDRAKRSTKLRIYAAGSFANIMTAIIVLVIMMVYFVLSFSPAGVFINQVNGTPAANANITGIITAIGGHQVYTQEDVKAVLAQYRPGDSVSVETVGSSYAVPNFQAGIGIFSPKVAVLANSSEAKSYEITLAQNPNNQSVGFLGVAAVAPGVSYNGGNVNDYMAIARLLLWIYIFALGVGIVNMLPIKPLDGGLVFEEIVGRFTKRKKWIVRAVGIAMVLVLIFNLIGPYFIGAA